MFKVDKEAGSHVDVMEQALIEPLGHPAILPC